MMVILFVSHLQEAETYALENSLFFMETSAKTATNVKDIFYEIGESFLHSSNQFQNEYLAFDSFPSHFFFPCLQQKGYHVYSQPKTQQEWFSPVGQQLLQWVHHVVLKRPLSLLVSHSSKKHRDSLCVFFLSFYFALHCISRCFQPCGNLKILVFEEVWILFVIRYITTYYACDRFYIFCALKSFFLALIFSKVVLSSMKIFSKVVLSLMKTIFSET